MAGISQQRVSGILTNAGTVLLRGKTDLYLYGGNGSGSLINLPGAVVDIQSDVSITRSGSYATELVVNEGILRKSVGTGISNISPSVKNTGSIEPSSGTLVFSGGGVEFPGTSWLRSENGATLRLTAGNLTGATTNSMQFSAKGRVFFDGGTRQLEVMSRDLGNVLAGYTNNFAYGSIELANGASLALVNNSDNAPGDEALYVDGLVVPSGTTLNLGGFHVYAKAGRIAGNVTGGTIATVPDSPGPIAINASARGSLGVLGEADEWTFYGRAGESVTLIVDTGTGNVLPPILGWAEVRWLDPSGNVVQRGTNSIVGQVLAMDELALPLEGIYRIQIRAPENRPASGNYQVAVVRADTAPLVLNRTLHGRIETPYSVDRWTFSAATGKQVRFDMVSASRSGVAFDLRGPSGPVGFTNLVADSELLNLVESGEYTLTAHGTGLAGDIAYAFQLIETAQTDILLGTNFIGQFVGEGQAQLLRLQLTNTGPVRVRLANTGSGNRAELYVRRSAAPTRGLFDHQSASGPGATRELLIPSAPAGVLEILVYADVVTTPGPFTLEARAAGIFLNGITPTRQANNATLTMTLEGAGFEAGAAVELLAVGLTAYAATNVSVDSFTQMTATFPPNLAPPGLYSVRVRQPDGDMEVLTNTFEMLDAGSPKLETRVIMAGPLGRHAVSTFYIEYANTGKASMPAPLLLLKSSDMDGSDKPILTLDESRIIQNFWSAGLPPGTANEILILGSGTQPGLLNPGEKISVPVYYLGLLQPWNFSDNEVEMEIRYWTADDPIPIDWSARKSALRPSTLDPATWDVVFANLTAGLTNTGAYVRMLSDNAQYLGRLGQRVVDVSRLWNFEVHQAFGSSALPMLDAVVEASVTVPGTSLEVGRRFASDIRARNSLGWFGRGWYTPWQASIAVESGGDLIKLVGEGGTVRYFTKDTRNGRYFSGPGDSSRLTAVEGGVYQLRDPNGTATRFRNNGRIDYVEDRNGNRVSATYDSSARLTSLSHTAGAWLSIQYNPAGLVGTITNSAGRAVVYAYEGTGNYLTTATTDDGKTTRYTYEAGGTAAQRHALTSVTRGGVTRTFTFDARGRLSSTWLGSGDQKLSFGYDSAGEINIGDGPGTTTRYYDHRGLFVKTKDALGNVTTSEFDQDLRLSRVIWPTGESERFEWSNGNISVLTDELGHTARFAYESVFNGLSSFLDARGNSMRYTYDAKGRNVSIVFADESVEKFGNHTTSGLPQTHTNRRGQGTSYEYTPSGQIARQTTPEGNSAELAYDGRGNLVRMIEHSASGGDRTTTYTYDYSRDGDRLRKVIHANGRWVELFYDGFGRRVRMIDSTGGDLRYDYDAAGRLWKVGDAATNRIAEYLYDNSGRLQRVNKGNNSFSSYEYDAAGQLLRLENVGANGLPNSRFEYRYDSRGFRRSLETTEGTWAYENDGKGRLVGAAFTSLTPTIPNQNLRYEYDATGNRTATISNGVRIAYAVNKLNQYSAVGDVVYQYDLDGNLKSDGTRTYAYDSKNRLIRVSGPEGIVEYEYDPLGHRTVRLWNGQRTEYLLDPAGVSDVICEIGANGTLDMRNIHGLGLVGRQDAAGSVAFYDFDPIGSTVGVCDRAGNILSRHVYEPFGSELFSTPGNQNPFRFVGQFGVEFEPSSLYWMQARHYASGIGRFTQPDPIGLSGGLHPYEYASNLPTSLIDPAGLDSLADVLEERKDRINNATTDEELIDALPTKNPQNSGLGYDFFKRLFDRPKPNTEKKNKTNNTGSGGGSTGETGNSSSTGSRGTGGGGGSGGSSGGNGGSGTATSNDPNQKLGPTGFGAAKHIPPGFTLAYRVDFENDTNATAPAQQVIISDQLSTNLDWGTFRLTDIGFGDMLIPVPAGSQHFETNVLMSFAGAAFQVEIEAGIRLAYGQVYAAFRSIDPSTSLPPAVQFGFLPPEDGTGRGQGHISYVINARKDLGTGTQIRNVAIISFDNLPDIATNQRDPHDASKGTDPNLEAFNTIDADRPSSSVRALPAVSNSSHFPVSWLGTDSGVGIAGYDVYVSTNNGPWGLWLSTAETGASFAGQNGNSYAFYSVARDLTGNVEIPPAQPDAVTRVAMSTPVAISVVQSQQSLLLWFPTHTGSRYRLESSVNLASGRWEAVGQEILGDDQPFTTKQNISGATRFYRVVILP